MVLTVLFCSFVQALSFMSGAEPSILEALAGGLSGEDGAQGPSSSLSGNRKQSQLEAMAERVAASNPMSVSVPNLTSNMEQTVSLLESFAAVARRNLGNVASPMGRHGNNASSLVRLALTTNGMFYLGQT